MKILVIVCALIGSSLADDKPSFYVTADDNLDIDSLMKDPARIKEFMDCFMGRAPCGEIAASYLKIIPDSIEKGCSRCSPAQKHVATTFLLGIRKDMPAYYEEFVKKFDPKGSYITSFLKDVKGF